MSCSSLAQHQENAYWSGGNLSVLIVNYWLLAPPRELLNSTMKLQEARREFPFCVADYCDCSESSPILLATAGQDTQVKLWRIEEEVDDSDSSKISVSKNCFTIEAANAAEHPLSLSVGVESVLCGHDDWVQSAEWDLDGSVLVTSSSDKTIIIWKEISNGELWSDTVRLGIVGGQAAGFYCAVFSKDAKQIVASSYFGGLYAWTAPRIEEDSWSAAAVCSGHVGAVRDIAWHPEGKFIVSVGEDRTTRVYLSPKNENSFVEVGRPQIHGHSMQSVTMVSRAVLVTGAEEKIFRVFAAPQTFVQSVCNIGGLDLKEVSRCITIEVKLMQNCIKRPANVNDHDGTLLA
ncbi:WD domain, G-beta repeat protein [Necator americanus]|uniref:Elongator complex protein 2 n=1 Tax=Necator americanus TaxID=51031 RepID=W2TYB7_NECAM|nr:WD domain, G-beta repeat protein [Necator americanus]ETN86017.1 WD domain, G-beta repeat protein [Necator americanus]